MASRSKTCYLKEEQHLTSRSPFKASGRKVLDQSQQHILLFLPKVSRDYYYPFLATIPMVRVLDHASAWFLVRRASPLGVIVGLFQLYHPETGPQMSVCLRFPNSSPVQVSPLDRIKKCIDVVLFLARGLSEVFWMILGLDPRLLALFVAFQTRIPASPSITISINDTIRLIDAFGQERRLQYATHRHFSVSTRFWLRNTRTHLADHTFHKVATDF